MKKVLLFTVILLTAVTVFGQQKYALVIGNGAYTNLTRLNNPVNDANDIEAALKGLGFSVDKLLNADRIQMQGAVTRLKNNLSKSKNAYGFFYYAGHGVQSEGVNYLIPVNADIPTENYLQDRALPVQAMLRELSVAGNELNIIVLDACRDNPFSWARSGSSRGLTVVGNQPADSIIVYATSAGSIAADGTGRNGLFTEQLLKNLKTPGLEVSEVFRLTGSDVSRVSKQRQIPAVYTQFFGTAYLGTRPQPAAPPPTPPPAVFESGEAVIATGSLEISTVTAGTARISGGAVNQSVELSAWGSVPIKKINAGTYRVTMRYTDGKTEEKTIEVGRAQEVKLEFSYRPPAPAPAPVVQPAAPPQRPVSDNMVRINGGTFRMGSPANEPGRDKDERRHQVTVSSFYMGKYEVTQKEWFDVMGTTVQQQWDKADKPPWLTYGEGDNYPMYYVNWFEAVEYCNKRSQKEGLTPAYTVNGTNVTWNKNANGYRLPTEAEWEYACRAGTTTAYNTGASISGDTGWYSANSGSMAHPVGQKPANRWGLHDMHGNVREWCWDRYGSYSSGAQSDPTGASSGSFRVQRGGDWGSSAGGVRSAWRFSYNPSSRLQIIGFRLVRP